MKRLLRGLGLAFAAEWRSRGFRGALLAIAGVVALAAFTTERGTDARFAFGAWALPFATLLLVQRAALERDRQARRGYADLLVLHDPSALSRFAARALTPGLALGIALAAVGTVFHLSSAWHQLAAPPDARWSRPAFDSHVAKRLTEPGHAMELPPFDRRAGEELVLPYRWRTGQGDDPAPIDLLVVLRHHQQEGAGVEEHSFQISGSGELRIAPRGAPTQLEALVLHRGGSGELRIALSEARLEGAEVSPLLASASLGGRWTLFTLWLGLLAATAATWMRGTLAAWWTLCFLPLAFFDPGELLTEHGSETPLLRWLVPAWNQGLGVTAWAESRPWGLLYFPWGGWAVSSLLLLALGAWGEARGRLR